MPLNISSLNSGSNGNCYYIGNQHEAVLIDAGLSCRETEKRMYRSGLNFNKIKAVFITHEHSDHTKGVEFITRKYKIPVFISTGTYIGSHLRIEKEYLKHFDAYEHIQIGGLNVQGFPKMHDASEPFSFIVTGEGITIGVMTDIGAACDHVIRNFGLCHAVFLEANYDEQMLETGHYPIYLKNRIRGDHGHLSNNQALEIFTKHKSEMLSHLLLSHLSRDNNDPHLVETLFNTYAGNTHIAIASRYRESRVFCITGEVNSDPNKQRIYPERYIQQTLF